MRKLLLAVMLLGNTVLQAQLQSPEAFLGYTIGTRFTPHHRIVAYFNHVAANSKLVKLQTYGATNEHRPLMVAFVGTENHISSLDAIRQKNIQLTHSKSSAADQPAIVWLSYNVHGNEPTSSEAAMQTLYALADPANQQTKSWLQNTLVVIDPCLNPDGRDRYVNWYNIAVGKKPNASPLAREHREPWPQGRSNHYNFDLNRDWAWQTQAESRQRMALYNQWLPQVHVDFHEQGFNEPYYFAPAAEPYHEVLTQWQRDFQVTIGKNHAKYFDANNWLYFTKERFDLFYPSYGDTYPLYNGAIGMTYEQGGIGGGLAVVNKDGDTLTLVERVLHHTTTGLSTVEVSAQHAGELVKQFADYFANSTALKNTPYKSFVVKYSEAEATRMAALKELLDKNGVVYGQSSGTMTGYNYHTKKEEKFSIESRDLVIATAQPKGVLAQVLFEPDSKLNDSITYDITAWAMPYAYGVKAYAVKSQLNVSKAATHIINNTITDAYGYIIPWTGLQSAKATAQLLQQGIKLRYTEKSFKTAGKSFPAGSIIILKTSNQKLGTSLNNLVNKIANEHQLTVTAATTGMVESGLDFGSDAVHPINKPNVVALTGNDISPYGAGEVWSFFENILDYPVTMVNANDISRIDWSNTDVIIFPAGNYNFLNSKAVADQLTNWIRNGGRLIALESAVAQVSKQEWSVLKAKTPNDSADDKKIAASAYADREKKYVTQSTPGAIFKVAVDNTHPLFFGYPDYYYTLKTDGDIYQPIKSGGWNTGVIKGDKQVAGFVGNELSKDLKNGVLFAVQDLGNGHIIYLTDNVLFRNFWHNGQLMVANAVFLMGN